MKKKNPQLLASGPGFLYMQIEFPVYGTQPSKTPGHQHSAEKGVPLLVLLRDLLFHRAPKGAWRASAPQGGGESAEHTGASSEGLSWCCSFISSCVKCRGRVLASPSSCPFSPCPQHHLWCCFITSHPQEFWHIHTFGFFFFSLLPLSLLYWLILV